MKIVDITLHINIDCVRRYFEFCWQPLIVFGPFATTYRNRKRQNRTLTDPRSTVIDIACLSVKNVALTVN